MVGVILFSFVGMFFGFLAADDLVKSIVKSNSLERFLNRLDKFDLWLGILGIFVGIWNLFSPNFGFSVGVAGADITIFGALIPSGLVILSGISISLNYILQVINVDAEKKEKILLMRNQYSDLIGVLTFVFCFLHLFSHSTVLL